MREKVFLCFNQNEKMEKINAIKDTISSQEKFEISCLDKEELLFSDIYLKGLIEEKLKGTSVTLVLIGDKTLRLEYIKETLMKSVENGNLIIGIKIGSDGSIGENSLYFIELIHRIYDYEKDQGASNLNAWINSAIDSKNLLDEIMADLIEDKIYR